ncbi:MAG: ribonuclease P protein component [Candidatus Yanofskybacteria bacterium CG10_big_fil_rev_8_21_14_0_10_36_16]|uniref:Ribonuclease P protein component n=1 Tax=Candidatus Yanofskybacteria bacterium CG10_big_fil_rev_8_21_14_0_10_36_16 TaxID=1975096 RepID=A0A2J0Q6T1_9BACT|nr:MAG: ribonuclease P protein component [Candidatus Yanofskybacteria bacterium CG10_big_fil_rev_8_21_14_0_10_36_16]
MSLPINLRLKKNSDFQKVIKNGKSVNGEFLFIKFVKNELDHSRFGIVVSSKVSSKATARNKIKRRISESISPIYKKQKTNLDIVVISIPRILEKTQKEIKSKLDEILNKVFSQYKK